MKRENILLTIMIILWALSMPFIVATYQRTKIVEYDIKRDHMLMSDVYNYCPICGAKLVESEE